MDFERIGNTFPLPAFEYLRPEDGSLQGTAPEWKHLTEFRH